MAHCQWIAFIEHTDGMVFLLGDGAVLSRLVDGTDAGSGSTAFCVVVGVGKGERTIPRDGARRCLGGIIECEAGAAVVAVVHHILRQGVHQIVDQIVAIFCAISHHIAITAIYQGHARFRSIAHGGGGAVVGKGHIFKGAIAIGGEITANG